MRGCSLSFLVIAFYSCAGCCCGSLPTFGFWPELDEAEVAAAVKNAPLVVDHVCEVGRDCEIVKDATIEVYPVGWNPFTGTVTTLVEVEATCTPPSAAERAEPFVCAGVLLAVGSEAGVDYVTENMFGARPSGLTLEEWNAQAGDDDWD